MRRRIMQEHKINVTGEIDLYDYLRVMWRWKWLIIVGVIVTILAAILVSSRVRTYESEGIFRLSADNVQCSVPEYIDFSNAFMNPKDFASYLETHGLIPEGDLQRVSRGIARMVSLQKKIKPIYVFEKEEYRRIDPEKQYVAAIEITWKSRSAVLAQHVTRALGLFAKHTFENMLMQKYVAQKYKQTYIQVQQLESELVDLRFSLKQNKQKLADLKKIAQLVPEGERLSSREVVSVDQGGYRYLPPSTQMVATQVEIADTNLKIADTERQLQINRVTLELFSRMNEALEEKDNGSLLDRLEGISETFFKGKDVKQDQILIVRNVISVDFARFEYRFRDVMQFASGPTLPKRAKPSTRFVVGVAFILGLFFFTLLAFFIEFIQRSREREMTKGGKKSKK
jgi:hypothetical protein